MSSCATVMTETLLFLFGLLSISLLSPRFLISFLSSLGGAPKIDLPLSIFSLANSFLTSLFLVSTLLVEGTKTVVLEVAILGKKKSYLKSVQSEVDF